MKKDRLSRGVIGNMLVSRSFLVFGSLILIVILYGLGRSMVSTYEVNKEISRLEGEIGKLESQNTDMTQLLHYLQTDDFVANEARTKLGLKKEGEQLVIVKETQGSGTDVADAQEGAISSIQQIEQQPVSNFRKWLAYLLNE